MKGEFNLAFRDIYTAAIFRYIQDHNNNTILYKDIMREFNISYPTVRKKIRNLIRTGKIEKSGKHYKVIRKE